MADPCGRYDFRHLASLAADGSRVADVPDRLGQNDLLPVIGDNLLF